MASSLVLLLLVPLLLLPPELAGLSTGATLLTESVLATAALHGVMSFAASRYQLPAWTSPHWQMVHSELNQQPAAHPPLLVLLLLSKLVLHCWPVN